MAIPHLDRLDRRILERLQADARISNLDLAESIGLSPTRTGTSLLYLSC